MHQEIIARLSELTEEEQFILVRADSDSQRSLYAKPGRFIIERRQISSIISGEATSPIGLRPHPRFRDFPTHSHDYIEIMYVCSGSITHRLGDRDIVLDTHSLIILGKDTKHSIKAAGSEDLGVNLIVSFELFELLINRIKQGSSLSTKALEALLERGGESFCVFSPTNDIRIKNIWENMISSVICQGSGDGYALQQSLELLLCYLASFSDTPESIRTYSYEEKTKRKILNYIRTSYSTATLTEAAQMLGLSAPYLSRWISRHMDTNFKELLMSERFSAAEKMLCSADVSIGDIINNVGYENSSYFHKEFKRRYGMPPNEYRKRALDKDA